MNQDLEQQALKAAADAYRQVFDAAVDAGQDDDAAHEAANETEGEVYELIIEEEASPDSATVRDLLADAVREAATL